MSTLPSVFEANLAALRRVDPSLADGIAAVPLPAGVRACAGRDGAATFRIMGDDGREHWFGGTSAPSVSAPALLDGFDAGVSNVMFVGIGQGAEVRILLDRLTVHRGVLVVEPELLNLGLALRLADFSVAIESGRLCLLVCPLAQIESHVQDFLGRHDGYVCPERLLRWPWQSESAIAAAQQAVQAAGQRVHAQRQRELVALRARWAQAARKGGTTRADAVAVVGLHAARETWEWAEDVCAAAGELGLSADAVVVRSPFDCDLLAIAQRLVRLQPASVVALNGTRAVLGAVVPEEVPIRSWVDRADVAGLREPVRLREQDELWVTSETLVSKQARRGVSVVPHAVGVNDRMTADQERAFEVVVLADAGPLDAATLGLELHTQQVLWQESLRILVKELDSFIGERARGILTLAEKSTRSQLGESSGADRLIHLLRYVGGPSLVARAIVERLTGRGIEVHVWGRGWNELRHRRIHDHGPRVAGDDDFQAHMQSKLIIAMDCEGRVERRTLRAAATGVVVLWLEHPADELGGGMRRLLNPGKEYVAFRSAEQAATSCCELLGNEALRREFQSAARRRIEAEHTMVCRLQTHGLVGHPGRPTKST